MYIYIYIYIYNLAGKQRVVRTLAHVEPHTACVREPTRSLEEDGLQVELALAVAADTANESGLVGVLAFIETKKQRPNTGARANNALHK